MGLFDRAGNLVKGLLRKPLRALERTPEERLLERELEEKAALERARANITDLESRGAPKPASPPPEPPPADEGGKVKRRLGPDD